MPPIHFERNFPPVPSFFGDSLRDSLSRIAERRDLDGVMRFHRYGEHEADQQAGAAWLADRFGGADLGGRIVLTNGAKNGVLLVLASLVKPGDVVLTEALSALGAWAVPSLLGVRVVGSPIDADGLIPEAFEDLCREHAPRALFTVPTLHNPTTHILRTPRRQQIIAIAHRYGVAIIEDDICGMLMPEPPPPFAALDRNDSWFVTGVGKALSPGLRLGYIVAPSSEAAAALISRFRSTTTWVSSPLSAAIMADWVETKTAFALREAITAEIAARQSILTQMLAAHDLISKPWALNGWLKLPDQGAADQLLASARERGVLLGTTTVFRTFADQASNAVRICIGGPDNREELVRALDVVRELAARR